MVSLAFLAALKVLIFHLTREEANVPNPTVTFLPSSCTESFLVLLEPNAEAAIEDLLVREPRLAAAPGMSELPVEGGISDCPEVPGVGKFDASPTDTRLEQEATASAEWKDVVNFGEDAVEEELRRLWATDCTIGNETRGSIESERS